MLGAAPCCLSPRLRDLLLRCLCPSAGWRSLLLRRLASLELLRCLASLSLDLLRERLLGGAGLRLYLGGLGLRLLRSLLLDLLLRWRSAGLRVRFLWDSVRCSISRSLPIGERLHESRTFALRPSRGNTESTGMDF